MTGYCANYYVADVGESFAKVSGETLASAKGRFLAIFHGSLALKRISQEPRYRSFRISTGVVSSVSREETSCRGVGFSGKMLLADDETRSPSTGVASLYVSFLKQRKPDSACGIASCKFGRSRILRANVLERKSTKLGASRAD